MDRDDGFSAWAGRLCFTAMAALSMLGMYYGNVRFAPIAAGFAILGAICYIERRGRRMRAESSLVARPSLSSGDVPRLPPDSAHSLGP